MKFEQVIRFLKGYMEHCGSWGIELPKEDESQFGEVIKLLEEGKKFKEMWEGFKSKRGDTYTNANREQIKDMMNDFEQKYFPEPKEPKPELVELVKKIDEQVKELLEEVIK